MPMFKTLTELSCLPNKIRNASTLVREYPSITVIVVPNIHINAITAINKRDHSPIVLAYILISCAIYFPPTISTVSGEPYCTNAPSAKKTTAKMAVPI